MCFCFLFFFFQAEDGIRDIGVTGVQTCALPISSRRRPPTGRPGRPRTPPDRASGPWRRPSAFRGSEERRVGKECRSRWWPYQVKKKKEIHMSEGVSDSKQ